jgi:single-stranded-DNA-specific exonuclease
MSSIFSNLSLLKNKWILEKIDENSLLNHILKQNKFLSKENYNNKSLMKYWPKLEDINDLQKAIEIIKNAVITKKKIGIVGDYDVDGSSSTALLVSYFKKINLNFIYKIPNRFTEGYGVSINILKTFIEEEVDIIITVDNGTTAYEAVNFAKENNKIFIVLDHHVLQNEITVDALVNPHVFGNEWSVLCATGVVFIFLAELNKYLFEKKLIKNKIDMYQYLDIVATATVCDVMPMIHINRALVTEGLKKINKTPIPGYKFILEKHIGKIDTQTIGFLLGPVINAPGRFAMGEKAVKFMLAEENIDNVEELSLEVINLNLERRKIEKEILALAKNMVNEDNYSLCVYGEEWHEGVIGIVAGRLKDLFNKPTCVFASNDIYYKGSMRTPDGFHIGNFIKEGKNSGIIEVGGGHAAAGGLTIKKENLNIFLNFFEEYIKKNPINSEKNIKANACISLQALKEKNMEELLDNLAPFGTDNLEPIFLFTNICVRSLRVINNTHFLMNIVSPNFDNPTTAWIFNPEDSLYILKNLPITIHCLGSIMYYKDSYQIKIIDVMMAN